MPAMLRALGAAALAAGQVSLSLTGNGTYLATVEMESIPVKLLVDAFMGDVWVKCTALEGPSCADGITTTTSGYAKTRLDRLERNVPTKKKRFVAVTIGGQVFNGFDAYVVYDAMAELDAGIQGIFGLNYRTDKYSTPSMYLDNQVSTLGLQLGNDERSSKLSLNTIDSALLRNRNVSSRATFDTDISGHWKVKATCLWVPLAGGNESTPECTTSGSSAHFDPACPTIGVSSTSLDLIERRFLYTCTAIKKSYLILYYLCDTSVKLPRLMFDLSNWRFYMDPVDYVEPISGSSQVKVLLGNDGYIYSGWVLGTPFLRKFPVELKRSSSDVDIYCQQNVTCLKMDTKRNNYNTPVSGGGTSGQGGTSGGDYDYDVDANTRRKNKKLYIAIGASVGGIFILALLGCCCKGCATEDKEEEEEDPKSTENVGSVQVTVDVSVGDSEDKDNDNDQSKGTIAAARKKKKRKVEDGNSSDDSSSSYDTDSSEERERRKERRRRRQRRRERRRAKREAERQQYSLAGGVAASSPDGTKPYYIGLESPRGQR